MARRLLQCLAAGACLALPAPALAADYPIYSPAPAVAGQCVVLEPTPIVHLPPAQLAVELTQLFADAVVTAQRLEVIYSSRPAYTWALETRFYCGEAIGYLKTGTVDVIAVSKCDCFHRRMVRFMP